MSKGRETWAERAGRALTSTLRWALGQDAAPVAAKPKGKRRTWGESRPAVYMDGRPSSTVYRVK
jgi:hypothetical protein